MIARKNVAKQKRAITDRPYKRIFYLHICRKANASLKKRRERRTPFRHSEAATRFSEARQMLKKSDSGAIFTVIPKAKRVAWRHGKCLKRAGTRHFFSSFRSYTELLRGVASESRRFSAEKRRMMLALTATQEI